MWCPPLKVEEPTSAANMVVEGQIVETNTNVPSGRPDAKGFRSLCPKKR